MTFAALEKGLEQQSAIDDMEQLKTEPRNSHGGALESTSGELAKRIRGTRLMAKAGVALSSVWTKMRRTFARYQCRLTSQQETHVFDTYGSTMGRRRAPCLCEPPNTSGAVDKGARQGYSVTGGQGFGIRNTRRCTVQFS